MHLHGILLIINLAITVVFSDNREVSVRYNVDNIKRNINTNDVNKISKLRLILLSDLKKPNEISVSAKMCFFLKYFFWCLWIYMVRLPFIVSTPISITQEDDLKPVINHFRPSGHNKIQMQISISLKFAVFEI